MKKILLILLATLLLIEEWIWDGLNYLGHAIVAAFNWQRYEIWLAQCSPRQALLCFFIPIILITPLNLLALKMLSMGLLLQGIGLEILIKLLATLVVSRIFSLTKPQLLYYRSLRKLYETTSTVLVWARTQVEKLYFYQKARDLKSKLTLRIHQWWFFRKSS